MKTAGLKTLQYSHGSLYTHRVMKMSMFHFICELPPLLASTGQALESVKTLRITDDTDETLTYTYSEF